ncbi:SH2 domain-containing protein 7 [Candoia aspera]|uniref:SH2 domain-containing protein 7 n=1 Tax=Candoia aspera TaxID=51853 RepID=UPI002FD86A09
MACFLNSRGKNRCRHFVISCQRNGHYVVTGDTRTHKSLAELINYYQTSEIQPFGENLTSACSKLEEKSIYDEISSDRNSSAAAPALSKNSSTNSLVTRSHSNRQPGNPRIQLHEEQKSFFKECQNSGPKEDPDAVLPVPDRSHLLKSQSLEEHVGGEGSIYSTVKKLPLDRRSLAKSKEGCRDLADTKAKEPEGLGQGHSSPCQKKMGTVFALAKQSDTPFTRKVNPVETAQPETIYSTIALDQAKSSWIFTELHNCQASLPPSKKSGVNVPNYPPPKLSPELLNKPQNSMEFQESPLGIYTSPVGDNEHGQLNQSKSLFGVPKEPMNEKTFKPENHQPTLGTDSTTNTQESFRWAKSIFLGSEKPPKSSPTKSKGSYEQISKKFGQPSKMQINPEDPYERIPDLYSKGSSTTSPASPLENPYEQIPRVPGKRLEAKLTQKSDKPRRFLFAEKKAKS